MATREYVPTGYDAQFSLENFERNEQAAGFRKRVVKLAETERVALKLKKNDTVIHVPLSGAPGRRMRGAARSVFGEFMRLYQFAPNRSSLDWTAHELGEILLTTPVITTEWLQDGEQKARVDLVDPEELAALIRKARFLVLSVERKLTAEKDKAREAEVADRKAKFEAAMAR